MVFGKRLLEKLALPISLIGKYYFLSLGGARLPASSYSLFTFSPRTKLCQFRLCASAPLRLCGFVPLRLCSSLCAALLQALLFWFRRCLSLVAPDFNSSNYSVRTGINVGASDPPINCAPQWLHIRVMRVAPIGKQSFALCELIRKYPNFTDRITMWISFYLNVSIKVFLRVTLQAVARRRFPCRCRVRERTSAGCWLSIDVCTSIANMVSNGWAPVESAASATSTQRMRLQLATKWLHYHWARWRAADAQLQLLLAQIDAVVQQIKWA